MSHELHNSGCYKSSPGLYRQEIHAWRLGSFGAHASWQKPGKASLDSLWKLWEEALFVWDALFGWKFWQHPLPFRNISRRHCVQLSVSALHQKILTISCFWYFCNSFYFVSFSFEHLRTKVSNIRRQLYSQGTLHRGVAGAWHLVPGHNFAKSKADVGRCGMWIRITWDMRVCTWCL